MEIKQLNKLGRVGVLMGGASSERDVSLKSGHAVYDALKGAGIEAVAIDIKSEDIGENIKFLSSQKIDCAFLALHGRFGEDGTIQEILDYVKVPYTGSGPLASRLSMDKIASRRILEVYGVPVPAYCVIEKAIYNGNGKLTKSFGFPLVVKPASGGSSIGLSIVDKEESFHKAIDAAFKFDETIIIEEFIRGRELTVGILKDKALPVIEIIPKNRFFDYEAKYQQGLTDYVVPAQIDAACARKSQDTALRAHKLLGCFAFSRADIILAKDGTPFILELNSIPGFTPTSLLPKAAHVAGIKFVDLCLKLIELAYEKEKSQ
ncbi:MAG: D-alanine--D-alanine ligase [Candidatus Omnitrophica bacterium]|nr:D-alanine--D-alanine ligase [Candidatus Omnitrophota bacterium]